MPAEQGVAIWPEAGRCAAALVDAQMLPLPDGSIDRLLLAHALEAADRPDALLEESWRITAPEGRMIVIVPSRGGVWARTDSTPYGQGLPYSKSQLRDLLQRADFSPIFWGEALHAPPIKRPFMMRSATTIERIGGALDCRSQASTSSRRSSGPSPGRRPRGRPGAARAAQLRARAERAAASAIPNDRSVFGLAPRPPCFKAVPGSQPKANSHARRSSPRPVAPWPERMEPQEPVHGMAGCGFEPRRSRGGQDKPGAG